jgi:3-oxoacyl-[acyl-carrier-protein] synthase-3
VLLVTADKLLDPSRYAREGLTVFSDGAAACVVSADPAESSFAVLGVATHSSPEIGDYRAADDFTLLQASGHGVAAVAAKLRTAAAAAEDVDHVVTSNFGASLRRFLAISAGYPSRLPFAPRAGEIGHCFSADLLINLREFERQDGESDGDRLLLLCSGPRSWTGIVVQAVEAPVSADAR